MSTFKIKSNKNKLRTQINTLDETHKKYMNNFQKRKKLLPVKKQKIVSLKNDLEKLESKNPSLYTTEDIKKRSQLKMDIDKLNEEVNDIENDVSEMEYYFRTEDIIMDYYDIIDHGDHTLYDQNPELQDAKTHTSQEKELDALDILNIMNKSSKNIKKVTKRRKKRVSNDDGYNILNFFNNSTVNTQVNNTANNTETDNQEQSETETETETEQSVNNTNNDLNLSDENLNKNKAELLDKYMMLVDGEYVGDRRKNPFLLRRCPECNVDKTLIQCEGIYVCQNCGEVEMIIIDSEKPNYKESASDTKPGYPYKRINHFNEWLGQFQAKESTEIPQEIYNQILTELKKNRFVELKKLTLPYIKQILKKLALTQYYEHATHIISKLSGIPPPTINRETEEKLRIMFKQIQIPFEKYCPKSRINFLSYSYVLHKFCELLELDDFIKCFPLLKSREKLIIQDKIWEKICFDLRWEYIPSV